MDVKTTQRVQVFLFLIFSASADVPVVTVSVLEGHHIILPCGRLQWRESNQMVWRRGLNQVIASRAWDIVFNINRNKHDLLPNGSLLVKYLRPEDSGEYYCNGDMVADVEVLTGQDYQVSAGRTIFLPCRISDKLKQKWIFRKNRRSVRKVILLKYKNGTVTKEIDDPQNRFITSDSELRIFNLQPMDAGEYFCNGVKSATLTVTTVATAAPDDIDRVTTKETDREPEESETKNKGSKGVSAPAVIGLFVLVLLSTLVCVSFWAAGKNTDKGKKQEGAELQNEKQSDMDGATGEEDHVFVKRDKDVHGSSPQDYTSIHYACLGHHNWKERPRQQEEEHHVIYSIVRAGAGQLTD